MSIDPVARQGFGRGAAEYDRARPEWPREALEAAFERLELAPAGAEVVDLAAGTGRLTRELTALGADVVAVEPVTEMREYVRDATAVEGTAESIPLPDASRDAVFVGEAFHWFDAARALPEVARVLRPCGGLAIMWHTGEGPRAEEGWRADVLALLADIHYHPKGRPLPRPFGTDPHDETEWRSGPGWEHFDPVERSSHDHEQRLAPDDYVALVGSFSFVGALDDEPRAKLLAEVRAVLDRHGVDEVVQRWRTDVYTARRRA